MCRSERCKLFIKTQTLARIRSTNSWVIRPSGYYSGSVEQWLIRLSSRFHKARNVWNTATSRVSSCWPSGYKTSSTWEDLRIHNFCLSLLKWKQLRSKTADVETEEKCEVGHWNIITQAAARNSKQALEIWTTLATCVIWNSQLQTGKVMFAFKVHLPYIPLRGCPRMP